MIHVAGELFKNRRTEKQNYPLADRMADRHTEHGLARLVKKLFSHIYSSKLVSAVAEWDLNDTLYRRLVCEIYYDLSHIRMVFAN